MYRMFLATLALGLMLYLVHDPWQVLPKLVVPGTIGSYVAPVYNWLAGGQIAALAIMWLALGGELLFFWSKERP